jgi:broad specificity phosphatase PhoE
MKIYFAPHATTIDNEAKIASGWRDVELSELGREQAKQMKEQISGLGIQLVCASDLKRAVDTVNIAFGDSLPKIFDERLREVNYGDYNGKSSEVVESLKMQYIHEPFPNGESYDQAMERIHEFYKELKDKHREKIILIVGHRATQYGLDTLIDGKILDELLGFPFKWQPYWEYDW